MGAVLNQGAGVVLRPLGFFSVKLDQAQWTKLVFQEGHTHLMTMMNRSMQLAEVIPVTSTKCGDLCGHIPGTLGGEVWQSTYIPSPQTELGTQFT